MVVHCIGVSGYLHPAPSDEKLVLETIFAMVLAGHILRCTENKRPVWKMSFEPSPLAWFCHQELLLNSCLPRDAEETLILAWPEIQVLVDTTITITMPHLNSSTLPEVMLLQKLEYSVLSGFTQLFWVDLYSYLGLILKWL